MEAIRNKDADHVMRGACLVAYRPFESWCPPGTIPPVDFLSRHLADAVAVGCLMAIVVILLWPMTMDRRQRWRNKRAARKFEAAARKGTRRG
jgi:hypothetical protein